MTGKDRCELGVEEDNNLFCRTPGNVWRGVGEESTNNYPGKNPKQRTNPQDGGTGPKGVIAENDGGPAQRGVDGGGLPLRMGAKV